MRATMNYQQFLFYNLTQVVDTKHPLKGMEYDEAFKELPIHYEEFITQDDRDDISEYEAIEQFLKNYA